MLYSHCSALQTNIYLIHMKDEVFRSALPYNYCSQIVTLDSTGVGKCHCMLGFTRSKH